MPGYHDVLPSPHCMLQLARYQSCTAVTTNAHRNVLLSCSVGISQPYAAVICNNKACFAQENL